MLNYDDLKSDNHTELSSAYAVNYDWTSNNEHDWTPVKYPVLGILNMSDHIDKKWEYQLVETLKFICMPKMTSIPDFFFEILQTCYFE